MKRGGDPRSALELDILRALVAFSGSLWASELPGAIERVYLGERPAPSAGELREALRDLSSKRLVKVEERVRASESSGGEKDLLVTLADERIRLHLLSDDVLNRYYLSVSESIKKAID